MPQVNLAKMNGTKIVSILKSQSKRRSRNELVTTFNHENENLKPRNVILLLNALQILDDHDPWLKGTGEIYVVSQATTGNLDDKTKSYTTYTTQTFYGVDNGDYLSLGQNGMVLWSDGVPNDSVAGKDPKEFIDFHIAIMESDKASRDIANDLEGFKDKAKLDELNSLIQGLSQFDPTKLTQIFSLSKIAFDLLIFGLKKDGDDHVGDFHDVLLRQQNYSPGRWPENLHELYPAGDARLAYKVITE